MLPVSRSGRGRALSLKSVLVSAVSVLAVTLAAHGPGLAQPAQQPEQPQQPTQPQTNPDQLRRVDVVTRRPPARRTARPSTPARLPQRTVRQPVAPPPAAPPPAPTTLPVINPGGPGGPTSPLNTNTIATSASRLGLTPAETPATVEVVNQDTMREQGYRTNAEVANGAVGVLSIDAAGAPAGFSMRGFTFGEVNVLYNGISTGPQSITSRVMDTANLSQVEFLKGPSSLMSGLNAIGGAVNYVSRQPTSGPIRNELDLSVDSLGTIRSHYGSGGNTGLQGLDYRFDAIESRVNGFINDIDRTFTNLSTQFNYRWSDSFKTFVAIDYSKDQGHAYWGTPMVPTTFAGPFATHGVVSGFATSTFDGSIIAPVTVDSRTLKTNYNTLDNSTGAEQLWLRTGFEATVADNLIVRDQLYYFQARRHWLDSETYAFDTGASFAPNLIDRDRFFVGHNQHLIGNNTDVIWDTNPLGMANRLAGQLQVSSNRLTFSEDLEAGFPADAVNVINPDRGLYGPLNIDIRDKRLDTLALSAEDRLKVTPWLTLIGGLRWEHMTLQSSGVNFDGSIPSGQPFDKDWNPASYRAAVTIEPVKNLMFYGMTATAFDPAAAGIFSVSPNNSLELTSSRIYEAGIKHLFWNNRAEWTLSFYDITRRNVFVPTDDRGDFALVGKVESKGIEFNAAVRPIDGLKLWGNVGLTNARQTGSSVAGFGETPSNVAPVIINAGASYRWDQWRWPVEIGGSVRHVGNRFLSDDDATVMQAFTTADVYAFVDIPGRDFGVPQLNNTRVTFRVRNITDKVYAAFSDPGYPDQVFLGAPRTYEVAASFKW